MTDKEVQTEALVEATPIKGGPARMVVPLIVALAVTAGIAFGTLALLDDGSAPANHETGAKTSGKSESTKATAGNPSSSSDGKPSGNDGQAASENELLSSLQDSLGAMDNVMKSLEFLDYTPEQQELVMDEPVMSPEDSLEQVAWYKREEDRLAKWESDLTSRQKQLEAREAKVSKQILRIEQAESARISSLAKLYDGMDPQSVTKLVANLEDDMVVAILPRMKQKNAAAVLAQMPSKRAARLSRLMVTIAEN